MARKVTAVVLACLIVLSSVGAPLFVGTASAESSPTRIWNQGVTGGMQGVDYHNGHVIATGSATSKLQSSGSEDWQATAGSDTHFSAAHWDDRSVSVTNIGEIYLYNSTGYTLDTFTQSGSVDFDTNIEYSPATGNVYTVTSDEIISLDPSGGTLDKVWTKPTDGGAKDIAVEASESRYAYSGSDGLHLVDMDSQNVVDTVNANFTHVEFNKADDIVYAFNEDTGELEAYNVGSSSLSLASGTPLSPQVDAIEYDERGGYLFVSNGGSGSAVKVFSADLSSTVTSFSSDNSIMGLSVDHETRDDITVYAAKGGSGNVAAWDTQLPSSSTTSLSSGGTDTISGVMQDQSGAPVSNGTVEIWGVPDDVASTKSKAEDLFGEVKGGIPTAWEPNLELVSDSGSGWMEKSDVKFVAINEKRDWGMGQTSAIDISSPIIRAEAGEPIVMHVREPKSGLGIDVAATERQLPGSMVNDPDQEIVIERLSPSGDVVDEFRTTTDERYDKVVGGDKYVATLTLTRGFYRVRPAGTQNGYVIAVGDVDATSVTPEVRKMIRQAVESANGDMTQRSKQISDMQQSGELVKYTTQTDSDGHFSKSIPSDITLVNIQGYRAGGTLNDVDTANLTVAKIEAEVRQDGYNGTVYVSQEPVKVEPPASGVEVTVRETGIPTGGIAMNQIAREQYKKFLKNYTANQLSGMVRSAINDASKDDLTGQKDEMARLIKQNKKLQEQYSEALAERRNKDESAVEVNLDELTGSTTELRTEVGALQDSISELRSEVQTSSTSSVDSGTVDATITLGSRLDGVDKESLVVMAQTSSGSAEPVPDKYVSVESGVASPDKIHVKDYPLPNGSSGVALSVRALTDEGSVVSETARADNPAFGGARPGVEAIEVSSLTPQAGGTATFEITPENPGDFGRVADITVTGPSGSTSTGTIESADSGSFSVPTTGTYSVEVTFENDAGDKFTEVFSVDAVDAKAYDPAQIHVKNGLTGQFALVSGLESADVSLNQSGQQLAVTGVVSDDTVPVEVHVYTLGADLAPSADVTLELVRESSGETVGTRYAAHFHMTRIGSEATVYRSTSSGETEAIAREGGGSGEVRSTGDGTIIRTYSDGYGRISVETDTNPGQIEQVLYEARTSIPEIGIPGIPLTVSVPVSHVAGDWSRVVAA